jgi:hypothetical protein
VTSRLAVEGLVGSHDDWPHGAKRPGAPPVEATLAFAMENYRKLRVDFRIEIAECRMAEISAICTLQSSF